MRVYHGLARWLGPSGADALFARALANVRRDAGPATELRLRTQPEWGLELGADSMQRYGAPAVAATLEALLIDVLELLGRLIGDDMTARIMEQSLSDQAPRNGDPVR